MNTIQPGVTGRSSKREAEAAELCPPSRGPPEDRSSYTITEFCRRNRISRGTFYNLKREGKAPRLMLIGAYEQRVSAAAELDWQRDREAEFAGQDPAKVEATSRKKAENASRKTKAKAAREQAA
jgi:hypothetical protein